MASKCITKLARSQPPSVSLNLHDYGLQVHTITASKCISKLARLQSPNSLHHSPHVHLQTRLITASKFAPLRPPSASPNSLDYGLQTRSIMASKCISKLTRLRPRSASLSSLDHGVVEWWSLTADSPSATLRCTSHGIRREFVRKSSSSLRSVGRGLEDMKGYPAKMNDTYCVDLRKLSKSAWDQELGKIECVFRILRWCLSTLGYSKYILPVAESISIIPVSLYGYI